LPIQKRRVERRFWGFAKGSKRGYFGNCVRELEYMRIYCRWCRGVCELRIRHIYAHHIRAIYGPQLAWEQTAIDPHTNRCRPDSTYRIQRSLLLPRARTFFCTDAGRRPYGRLPVLWCCKPDHPFIYLHLPCVELVAGYNHHYLARYCI
jgi:hypothetical protein